MKPANFSKRKLVASAMGLMASKVAPSWYFCFFLVSVQTFTRNSLLISVQIPNILTAVMLSFCLFIALALLGLSLPANTTPSPQLKEVGDNFALDDDIIPFDPNYNIATDPYIPTDPLLKAQIDGFSVESTNSPSEPFILAQINDQGVVPNPDNGNDPDIEAGGICRKTKSLFCCKGQYDTKTHKVAQPCKLCTLSASSSPQLLCFCSKPTIHTGLTEEAIFCNHAPLYCCLGLDVGSLSFLPSIE